MWTKKIGYYWKKGYGKEGNNLGERGKKTTRKNLNKDRRERKQPKRYELRKR